MDSELIRQVSLADGSILGIVATIVGVAWKIIYNKLKSIIKINEDYAKKINALDEEINTIKKDYMSNDQMATHLEQAVLKPLYEKIAGLRELFDVKLENLEKTIQEVKDFQLANHKN